MSDQKQQAKVLRIGIIHDGELVKELQVNAGDNVTVGSAEDNTFVFEGTKLDANSFPIFVWKDGEPAFNFGKLKGKPLRVVASDPDERSYLNWILQGNFEEDAKTLVREAIAGRIRQRPPRPRA